MTARPSLRRARERRPGPGAEPPEWRMTCLAAVAACVIVSLLYLPLGRPLALGMLVLIAVVACWRPAGVLVAIPAALAVIEKPVQVGALRFNPSEVLLAGALLGVGARAVVCVVRERTAAIGPFATGVIQAVSRGFGPAALALLAVGTLSLYTVADPSHRAESIREFRWVILEPVAFFFLARWYLRERGDRLLAGGAYVVAAAATAFYGVLSTLGGAGLAVEGVVRISATYPHPNALALYLERALPFAVALGLARRPRHDVGWFVPAAVIGAGLLMTFSRGAYIGAGAGLILVTWLVGRRRLAAGVTLAGFVLIGVLGVTAGSRILSLFEGGSGSLRIMIWQSSIAMIRDHPIFGVGLDQFLYQYAPRYIQPAAWMERFTSHPHNLLLDLWLRLGIMGLVVAAGYVIILIRRVRYIVGARSQLGLGALGALTAGAIHGLVDNGYFLPGLALAFWFMSALIDLEVEDLAAVGHESDRS